MPNLTRILPERIAPGPGQPAGQGRTPAPPAPSPIPAVSILGTALTQTGEVLGKVGEVLGDIDARAAAAERRRLDRLAKLQTEETAEVFKQELGAFLTQRQLNRDDPQETPGALADFVTTASADLRARLATEEQQEAFDVHVQRAQTLALADARQAQLVDMQRREQQLFVDQTTRLKTDYYAAPTPMARAAALEELQDTWSRAATDGLMTPEKAGAGWQGTKEELLYNDAQIRIQADPGASLPHIQTLLDAQDRPLTVAERAEIPGELLMIFDDPVRRPLLVRLRDEGEQQLGEEISRADAEERGARAGLDRRWDQTEITLYAELDQATTVGQVEAVNRKARILARDGTARGLGPEHFRRLRSAIAARRRAVIDGDAAPPSDPGTLENYQRAVQVGRGFRGPSEALGLVEQLNRAVDLGVLTWKDAAPEIAKLQAEMQDDHYTQDVVYRQERSGLQSILNASPAQSFLAPLSPDVARLSLIALRIFDDQVASIYEREGLRAARLQVREIRRTVEEQYATDALAEIMKTLGVEPQGVPPALLNEAALHKGPLTLDLIRATFAASDQGLRSWLAQGLVTRTEAMDLHERLARRQAWWSARMGMLLRGRSLGGR